MLGRLTFGCASAVSRRAEKVSLQLPAEEARGSRRTQRLAGDEECLLGGLGCNVGHNAGTCLFSSFALNSRPEILSTAILQDHLWSEKCICPSLYTNFGLSSSGVGFGELYLFVFFLAFFFFFKERAVFLRSSLDVSDTEPGLSNTYKAQGSETGVIPICPFPPSPRWGEKRTTQTVVIIGTKEGCLGRIREGFPKRRCCCGSLCPQAGHLPQEECMCGWRLVVVWAGGVKQKPADPLEDFKDCT